MSQSYPEIETIIKLGYEKPMQVQTLGNFAVAIDGSKIESKKFGREVTSQLFQFLITNRIRQGLHREQIIDRIWYDLDQKAGQQNFKVAHHEINKILEPNREKGADPKYFIRNGLIYLLDMDYISVDIDMMEQLIAIGNQYYKQDPPQAMYAYHKALDLDHGSFLPNRLYEDWTSEERERIQLLTLNAYMSLSELSLEDHPAECIRLTQKALLIDNTWEDAYRLQMRGYLNKGNRPMAIKTYQACEQALDKEYGIEPLPETKKLLQQIKNM